MEQYNKILIRASLTDDGTLPRTGVLSNSPDVIPYGTAKVADPGVFFIENYDENVGTALKATQLNYIYMRGKDLVAGLQKGDMYVYFAKDADLDSPKKWANNMLKTSSGKNFNAVVGQAEGTILVGAEAYEWTPPAPTAGDTYSLIGIVVASGTIPNFTGIKDFEAFVAANINVGWNKVTIKKPVPPPVPGYRWQTSFAYEQGSVERDMNFEIVCKGIPGGYVSFKADNVTGPTPPILLNETGISDPNARFGIESTVPAGYKSTITFSFSYTGTPPAGSSVTFRAYYLEAASNSGPQKTIVVASVTTTN